MEITRCQFSILRFPPLRSRRVEGITKDKLRKVWVNLQSGIQGFVSLFDELSSIEHELRLPANHLSVARSFNALDSAVTAGASKPIKL